MVPTVEEDPAKVLLRESHLHDEPQGRKDVETLAHGLFILQVGIAFTDQLIAANVFATQSVKLKDTGNRQI